MKKGLFVILTLGYLIFSVGVVNFSVLCLELSKGKESAELLHVTNPNYCSKCGKCLLDPITGEESGCCENKTELVKVDIDQSLTKSNIKISADEFVLFQTLLPLLGLQDVEAATQLALSNHTSIPHVNTVPINILNCIYRI